MSSASRIRGRLAHGGLLLVPVRVHGQTFEFLIDTGAAYIALSKDIVTLLDLTVVPQRTLAIAPAQGNIFQAPVVTLREFQIGGFRLMNITAIVLAFPQALRIDGIVGMNVLRLFRFTIETDTATLILRPPVPSTK